MAKRPGRKVKFNLTVGEDPSLWRYASVHEALSKNKDLIAKLIRAGEQMNSQSKDVVSDSVEVSESA